jgi:cytochrome c oxidase cbb3-type subunit III
MRKGAPAKAQLQSTAPYGSQRLPSRDGYGAVARKSRDCSFPGIPPAGPVVGFHRRLLPALLAVSLIALASGCDNAPGKPKPAPLVPEEIGDFKDLYAQNCQGCHGEKGGWGPAPHISDPLYLKLTTPQIIRKVIAEGRHGTPMPVFSAALGGALSDQQINTLVDGIEKAWATPINLHGTALPPYSEADSIAAGLQPGDPDRGHNTYLMYCARCHGVGNGKSLVGAIANPSYLALVSNQSLRTTAIIGRSDLGMPDWRSRIPNRTMSNQEISDVVAWLASQRPAYSSVPTVTASLPAPVIATAAQEPKP